MKIYNEIIIDMNPESSSYGETVHEDSFEYQGPMMLASQAGISFRDDVTGDVYTTRYGSAAFNQVNDVQIFGPDGQLIAEIGTGSMGVGRLGSIARSSWERHIFKLREMEQKYPGMDIVTIPGSIGNFEIDPTREQLKESVLSTGSYGQLAEGFGMEESDFEEFYGKPLEFMKEGRDIGEEQTGLAAGKSLKEIKEGGDVAAAKGGMAFHGGVEATQKTAQKGVFQDYKTQQDELALAHEQDVASFWKTEEDKFYERLTEVEELESA